MRRFVSSPWGPRCAAALTSFFVAASFVPQAIAQANQDPDVDVFLADVSSMQALGRLGSYPNGVNGVTVSTTICNIGNKPLPWMGAMNINHPVIGFLVARESNGRFEQISDRSFVKHGFFAMGGSACGTCTVPIGVPLGSVLGIGCSDVYDATTNGSRFVLGPADEIDPWSGIWGRRCSYFDRGDPAVPAPNDCDGKRSLSAAQAANLGPVKNRITITDSDLGVPGANYFGQAQYVVRGEPEAVRDDSVGSRRFTPIWNGSKWTFPRSGPVVYGSILQRWSGATVTSGTNETGGVASDGRVFVAVRVTGPTEGLYHYEYAVHNRDNRRGVAAFRVPMCSDARVLNMGFDDIDADPANDWSMAATGSEIVFSTVSDPMRWNTIYNFWFDSDAGPASLDIGLDAFDPGSGNASFGFTSRAPGALHNVHLGPGCSVAAASRLYATGTPARALLGNQTFGLESAGNAPGMPNLLLGSLRSGATSFLGCTLWFGGPGLPFSLTSADAIGVARHSAPVPISPALEGLEMRFQSLGVNPGGGALFGIFDLSNGLGVRVGDLIGDCP